MALYKLISDRDQPGVEKVVVKSSADGKYATYIPFDEGNRDYQEYLEWVAKGNTPEEAD
tara:strand:- start:1044 stop:1220 length:177 start_codon:yes stop_codon:yes gene_type:complete